MLLFGLEVRVGSGVLGQESLPLWQEYIHISAPVSIWGLPGLAVSKKQAEQGLRVI